LEEKYPDCFISVKKNCTEKTGTKTLAVPGPGYIFILKKENYLE